MPKKVVKQSDIFRLAFKLEDALRKEQDKNIALREENKQLKEQNAYMKKLLKQVDRER